MSVHVIIQTQSRAEVLVYWGVEFALARGKSLHVLVIDEQAEVKDEILDLEGNFSDPLPAYVQKLVKQHDERPETVSIRYFQHPDLKESLVTELYKEPIGLLLVGKAESAKVSEAAGLSRFLFQKSPWRTMLLRPGTLPEETPKVLVPAGGGPHSHIALSLSAQLVARREAKVSPLFVETSDYRDGMAEEVGRKILDKLSRKAGLEPGDPKVEPLVVVNREVQTAIGKVARNGFDLVMIGQAARVSARYWLFGTLPMEGHFPTLAVVRKSFPLQNRLRERASALFTRHVPQLSREERVDLFARLETNSRWNFDFIALLMLSTAIAGLGLALNSTAVVIGAMLVAPLMTPIIGAALGLVQGNIPLLGTATKAITFGFLTAMFIGVVIGFCDQTEMNNELAGRAVGPGVMDLLVGFFSGLAAAYCTGRTGLSAALPGVAIAAALVPPVATTGICLARGLWTEAGGAAALFGINVLTIIIGAAMALLLTGVRIRKYRIFLLLFGGMLLASLAIGAYMGFR